MANTTKGSPLDAVQGVLRGIGERLREVRGNLDITQKGMAARTGFSIYRIGNCEMGREFDEEYIAKVAELGNVDVEWILGSDLAPAAVEEAVEVVEAEPEPEADRSAELAANYADLARTCAMLTAASKLVKSANDEARHELTAVTLEMRGLGNAPKTSDVILNDTKVGVLTMAAGKDWAVDDEGAYGDWALEHGLASEYFTLDTRSLTDDQREMLEVWSHANGVELRHHVDVYKDADKQIHRIGDKVIASASGEVVPGLIPCEPTYTPRMTVKDPQLVFAAIGAGNVLGIDAAGLAGPAVPLIEGEVEHV